MEQLATSETREAAIEHYIVEDLTRPPFSYESRKPRMDRADESLVFEMEKRVFQCDQLPEVPPSFDEESPLKRTYKFFKKAQSELNKATSDTMIFHAHALATPTEHSQKMLKLVLKNHHESKTLYLKNLMAYLSIFKHTPGTTNKDAANELFHETETIFLAHQVYVGVRSFTHDHSPLREDNDTVMKHVYEVSIATMNFFIRKLARENDTKVRELLFTRMKENMIVGLAHDLKEDHRNIPLDTMHDTLLGLTVQDSRLINLIHAKEPGEERIRTNINFLKRRWRTIRLKLIALTKPEQKACRPGYLRRQIRKVSITKQADLILTKILDRDSNILSLTYMSGKEKESKEFRQNRKIAETEEIIEIALEIYAENKDPDLLEEIQFLAQACISESERLEREHSEEIKEQQISTQIHAARAVINAQLNQVTELLGA